MGDPPNLRLAVSKLYKRRFDVDLDPETEAIFTIGAKEGLSHLMWVLVAPGDAALVPTPSYPIHIYAPLFAGADVRTVHVGPGQDFLANLKAAWDAALRKPKVLVFSFPHNPTTACLDMAQMQSIVDFAREHEIVLVHDFAYSDTYFDGDVPPSVLQVPGAKDIAVELYTMTNSFSMAGWRVAFTVAGRRGDRRADQAEELPGLWDLPAHPDRVHRRLERSPGLPQGSQRHLQFSPRMPVDGLPA